MAPPPTNTSEALQTKAKLPEDAFSDLRNGTITLPLIFLLAEQPDGLIQHLVRKNMAWSAAFEGAVFDEMLYSGALFKSIQNTRILGELAIAHLPLNELPAALLADSCEIVHWNKFLAPCLRHPSYQVYRQTAYHERTRRLIRRLRRERQELPKPAPVSHRLLRPWLRPDLPSTVTRVRQLLLQESLGGAV